MTAQEPIVIEPTMQKDIGDCGVACLRMLTGLSYEQVLSAFSKRAKVKTIGISNRQMLRAARKLGFPLSYGQPPDLSNVVGIFDLHRPTDPANPDGEWEGHFVIVAKGTLYNPADGTWWTDVDSFLSTRRWRPVGVFVRRDQEDKEL